MGWFIQGHRYGNWIFAVRSKSRKKKGKGPWRVMATVSNRLRKSLEEFSFKKWEICPLVSCHIAEMGQLYSMIPEAMYNTLPSLDEIHCNSNNPEHERY